MAQGIRGQLRLLSWLLRIFAEAYIWGAICEVGNLFGICVEGGKDVTGGIQGSKISQSSRHSGVAAQRSFNQKAQIATLLTHITRPFTSHLLMQRHLFESQEGEKRTDNVVLECSETVSDYASSAPY